jgi:LacI family transcriptional regulator
MSKSQGAGRRATLADVAQLSGVDRSTASRILNGSANQSARPETRQRVMDAARELDYRPDTIAKSLRSGRTETLALFVPNLENFGFVGVTRGVQKAAHELGMLVLMVEASREMEIGSQRIEQALERRVDGILVASTESNDPLMETFARLSVPVVLVNRRAVASSYPFVVVDDERGSEIAVDHLIELGHRRIGHIAGDQATDTGRRRLKAFRATMKAHKLPVPTRWIQTGGFIAQSGYEATLRLLQECADRNEALPTALYVANLASCLGVLMALRESGLRVPQDMSVVAMDDHAVAAGVDPGITTVAMPHERMGSEAVHMLMDVRADRTVKSLIIQGDERLIKRGSTGPP